jgi:protein PhnA
MSINKIEQALIIRSEEKCELCQSRDNLSAYEIPPHFDGSVDESLLLCNTCQTQIDLTEKIDLNHWRCLNDSMWSQIPAVQVMAWRMLDRLKAEGWPQDLLDMLYLDEAIMAWAQAEVIETNNNNIIKHQDSNGSQLNTGDTVIIIKDLNVKGTSFVAKRGTAVRNISLVIDNAEHIEGRVNGQKIVILTKFIKKSN